MIFRQYYLGCLSHASYLLGDAETGTAIVIDPQRDVDQYLRDAKRDGLTIRHVILTHFHADFVAGHMELARGGATIHLGRGAEADYAFEALGNGERLRFPSFELEVMETPGHTPEAISLVLHEPPGGPPKAVFTGDTLFNGDVGRPDLLASVGYSAEQLAQMLFHSLQKLLALPDDVLVYPAHGAGSACGRAMSDELVSTIGHQRRHNLALQASNQQSFVEEVTRDLPPAPAYFAYNARLNKQHREVLEEALERELVPLGLDYAIAAANRGAQLVDTRDADDFAQGHLIGSVNIGLDGSFATWAGSLLDVERPIVLVAEAGKEHESAVRLGRVGYDNVLGYLEQGSAAWQDRSEAVRGAPRYGEYELASLLAGDLRPVILDVRDDRERTTWVASSIHVPLGELKFRMGEVPRSAPVLVHCAGGYRSSIAASMLRDAGYDARDVRGGIDTLAGVLGVRWLRDGVPQLKPRVASQLIASGALLVDVREADEFAQSRAPGALHVPMNQLEDRLTDLPRQRHLIIQCRSGNRSQTVAALLQSKGFEASNLAGGLLAWKTDGLPIEAERTSPHPTERPGQPKVAP